MGAGLAGLHAAMILSALGADVVALEVSARLRADLTIMQGGPSAADRSWR